MAEAFLKVTDLYKHFGENKVLDGVSLDVAKGKVTTIIGKSGMGKSVMLKCIADIISADSGSIELNGHPIHLTRRVGNERHVPFSFMFQNNALFDSLTAFENVAMPLREASKMKRAEISERVEDLLTQMDLKDAMQRYPGELSGGMKKRVAFARALVTDPQIVMFDEPTTGLDPERKFGVFDLIAEYRERFGFTAVLVSHDIPEVFDISDYVAWLDSGKVRFFGDPQELSESEDPEVIEFLSKAKFGPPSERSRPKSIGGAL